MRIEDVFFLLLVYHRAELSAEESIPWWGLRRWLRQTFFPSYQDEEPLLEAERLSSSCRFLFSVSTSSPRIRSPSLMSASALRSLAAGPIDAIRLILVRAPLKWTNPKRAAEYRRESAKRTRPLAMCQSRARIWTRPTRSRSWVRDPFQVLGLCKPVLDLNLALA